MSAEDRLARALLDLSSRITDISNELREEKLRVKDVLQDLDAEGLIDLDELKRQRQTELGGPKQRRKPSREPRQPQ